MKDNGVAPKWIPLAKMILNEINYVIENEYTFENFIIKKGRVTIRKSVSNNVVQYHARKRSENWERATRTQFSQRTQITVCDDDVIMSTKGNT